MGAFGRMAQFLSILSLVLLGLAPATAGAAETAELVLKNGMV